MQKSSVSLALLCGVALLPLGSCSHQIDQMHIRFTPDQHGTFSASGYSSLSDGDAADPDNSSDVAAARKIEAKLRDCGMRANTYTRWKVLRVDARSDFDSPEELSSLLKCVPTTWKDASIDVRRTEGWINDTFETTLTVSQNVLNPIKGSASFAMLNFQDFPTHLSLFVPGEIANIDNRSDVLGGMVEVSHPEPDLALIELKLEPNSPARARYQTEQTKALVAGKSDAGSQEDVVKVVVTSSKGKISLDNILSLAAIIFGSGLLFELSRRIFRVRIEPRRP